MKNMLKFSIITAVAIAISGCLEEKPTTPVGNSDTCSRESIASIADKKARDEQSAKCMTSGTYVMPAPKTF